MLAILNSLNAHNFPIFQPIFMILVSKFMVHRVLSDKIYFILGLLSPLNSLRKRKKMLGQPRFLSLFLNSFNKFGIIGALM